MTDLFICNRLISLRPRIDRLLSTSTIVTRLIIATLVIASLCCQMIGASEFPERECCDELPTAVDSAGSGLDISIIRKTPPDGPALPGNSAGQQIVVAGVTTPFSTLSSMSTEMPAHSSEHPDTSNFLYPEFIPELSLDLGYPLPPPPSSFHPHHHQHPHPPPDGTNYVPTTTGTGTAAYIDPCVCVCRTTRQTGEINR